MFVVVDRKPSGTWIVISSKIHSRRHGKVQLILDDDHPVVVAPRLVQVTQIFRISPDFIGGE